MGSLACIIADVHITKWRIIHTLLGHSPLASQYTRQLHDIVEWAWEYMHVCSHHTTDSTHIEHWDYIKVHTPFRPLLFHRTVRTVQYCCDSVLEKAKSQSVRLSVLQQCAHEYEVYSEEFNGGNAHVPQLHPDYSRAIKPAFLFHSTFSLCKNFS